MGGPEDVEVLGVGAYAEVRALLSKLAVSERSALGYAFMLSRLDGKSALQAEY